MYKPAVIYIENDIANYEYTQHILAKFPETKKEFVTDINKLIKEHKHKLYDKKDQPLLLAKQRGRFLEKCPGTKEHICCNYYTLNIAVGCPFDCTYCFLQSYTTNPFYTVYVNLEEMLAELEQKIPTNKKIRIGTGEFTDSLALEEFTDFAKLYVPKILKISPNIILELKTKSANINWLKDINCQQQLVIAWSVNPPSIINSDEKYASTLPERISAAKEAVKLGYKIALHFDPIIYSQNWESEYKKVIDQLKANLTPANIYWLSLGILRFTPSLKPIIEKKFPRSNIIYGEFFPGKDKKMRYPEPIRLKIYTKMLEMLKAWDPNLPVYFCMESPEIWAKTLGKTNKTINHLFS
jgi:spore photoproduct lyase